MYIVLCLCAVLSQRYQEIKSLSHCGVTTKQSKVGAGVGSGTARAPQKPYNSFECHAGGPGPTEIG